MSQIFISHVEEDESIALEIAHGLEAAGYPTWYYERDSLPGVSYLDQIDEAIEQSQAVVVIISLDSLSSLQVDKEVERAHESGKHFVPVLRGVKHVEFQTRKRGWRMAMGVSTSISVPADGASTIIPRIVAGLRRLVINSERTFSSPLVSGQTVSQDVSFSEPTDHRSETGEARLLQSEAVAEQPLLDTTSAARSADTNAAQMESANQLAVDIPISTEGVAARTDRTIPGIRALLHRAKTRPGMIVVAVLVLLGFASYELYLSKSRQWVTGSDQAQSKKTEPSAVASGQSSVEPNQQAAHPKKIDPASSIAGTIWVFSNGGDEFLFKPNGVLGFKRRSDGQATDSTGHWEQSGNYVKFDLNHNYTYFEVALSPDGNEMKGTQRYAQEEGRVNYVSFRKVP